MIYKHLLKIGMAFALSTGICATMPMPVSASEKIVVIGQQKNADYSFKIVNQLKSKITGLRIKTSEEEMFRANELTTRQAINRNKSVKFNYTLFDGETEETSFMMRIGLSNGKIYTLNAFPMAAINKKVYIKQKNGIVYLRYRNADGEYVSTYSQEKAALTKVNEDGTTVENNETDEEEAKTTQSNKKSDTTTTSKPVNAADDTADADTTDDTQNANPSSKPVGGACSTPESCERMRKSLDEASGAGSSADATTTDQSAASTDQ